MIFVRRRLLFWLLKAYFRKWGKQIVIFFVLGLLVFLGILKSLDFFATRIPVGQKESMGIVGTYTIDTMPPFVLSEVSYGLTKIAENGQIVPGAAQSWKVEDNGKKYTFNLKKDVVFSDKKKLTSKLIEYRFSDVSVLRPDDYTVTYQLKDAYSPFLITVSRPIFKKGFVGIGEYKITKIDTNGSFVQSLSIVSVKNSNKVKSFHFYPTAESVKTAYLLGEVNAISAIPDTVVLYTQLENFKNTQVKRVINYDRLVTLFYNNRDSSLSDPKLRGGLTYGLPDVFPQGIRNPSPYSPHSWIHGPGYQPPERFQDLVKAKDLIATSTSKSAEFKVTIKTLDKYKTTADIIAKEWKLVGVNSQIEEVDSVPTEFQIFLGDFLVPKDPDQYTLWHKDQPNNITGYTNLRIDKLLEDGRKITDADERQKIYAEFQKYLLADSPAAFLYFPYELKVSRK